ncbi:unnamed protein product [Urochloa humidicola]
MNRPEWKQALLGCAGAVLLYSYSLDSLLEVYFLGDNSLIRSKTRLYSLVFFAIAIVCITANIVQHYNFAVMGERLTERVRAQMLAKILSFEVAWFDEDENSSAMVTARLATQATKVRSLVGDRMCLLVQAVVNATDAGVDWRSLAPRQSGTAPAARRRKTASRWAAAARRRTQRSAPRRSGWAAAERMGGGGMGGRRSNI